MTDPTKRVRGKYDRLAPIYDRIDLAELTFKRPLRKRLYENLSGRILDAGVGTGANMPFYPAGSEVVGLDISVPMLRGARRRRDRLGSPTPLVAGDVTRTPFPDDTFDAVTAAFLFGVIDDTRQRAALAELARICRPDGEIRLLDHCYSRHPLWRVYMAAWLPWEKFVYGGAFDRPTARLMPEIGLQICRREMVFKDMVQLLVARPGPARGPTDSRISNETGARP